MPVSQAVVICGFGELGQTVSSSHQAVHDHLLHNATCAAAQSDPQPLHATKGSQLAVIAAGKSTDRLWAQCRQQSGISPRVSACTIACRWPTCWSPPWR